MSIAASVLIVVVGCFLVITIFAQIYEWGKSFSRFDPFRLIPRWTFFAPNPAVHDTNLVVRMCNGGGNGPWQAVKICESRRAVHMFWNPDKRIQKMVTDLTQSLISLKKRSEIGDAGCPTTLPYLLLFHYCAVAAYASEGVELEFAVVRTTGRSHRRIWIIFKSGVHRL